MAQIGPRLWEADCHECGETLSRCTCPWRVTARRIIDRRMMGEMFGSNRKRSIDAPRTSRPHADGCPIFTDRQRASEP